MTNSETHDRKTARSDLENRQKICRFPFHRKIYSFGELFHMLGRELARSRHRNACTSSCLRKGLMDNQDSEITHLKFVACVFFEGPQSHWLQKREGWYEKEDVMGLVHPIRVE